MAAFRVTLSPSGRAFDAEPDRNVLQSALDAGVALPYSCRTGNCRTCRAKIVSGEVDLGQLDDGKVEFDGSGLGRKLSVYRLPEMDWSRQLTLEHNATFHGGADLPVYVRVTQADGHQAWSSPIYLIA